MKRKLLHFSSITKKIIMALSGLFLITFLLVHLTLNFFLLSNDGGAFYGKVVGFMTSNVIIKIFEYVLMFCFLIHLIYAIIIQIKNWRSRPIRYKVEGFSHTSFFSKYMIHTGTIVLLFLLIHFFNFYFVRLGWVSPPEGVDSHDFYTMCHMLFSNGYYVVLYTILMVFLGFHLNHAFQSAFLTMGLHHSKYTPFIKFCGLLYSILVPLGFAIIPIYIYFT